jgi:hypothetical protein
LSITGFESDGALYSKTGRFMSPEQRFKARLARKTPDDFIFEQKKFVSPKKNFVS